MTIIEWGELAAKLLLWLAFLAVMVAIFFRDK